MVAVRLQVFAKLSKRRLISHPKFYYFDAGVFQAIRPRGPLDGRNDSWPGTGDFIFPAGARVNDYNELEYRLHYWRTASGDEVDFVLYGKRGLRAFQVNWPTTSVPTIALLTAFRRLSPSQGSPIPWRALLARS